jgi:hypothetical protein
MDETINELKSICDDLDDSQISNLQGYLQELLVNRTPDAPVGKFYDRMRLSFTKRFKFEQIDHFRPWMALPKTDRKRFKEALLKAVKSFTDMGFNESPWLYELIITLVSQSTIFTSSLNFKLVIEALNRILDIFDGRFPGYRTNGAVEILKLLSKVSK